MNNNQQFIKVSNHVIANVTGLDIISRLNLASAYARVKVIFHTPNNIFNNSIADFSSPQKVRRIVFFLCFKTSQSGADIHYLGAIACTGFVTSNRVD